MRYNERKIEEINRKAYELYLNIQRNRINKSALRLFTYELLKKICYSNE